MGILQKWGAGIAGFLILALLVGLAAFIGHQSLQIRGLQKAYADIQLDERIRKASEEAARSDAPVAQEFDLAPLLDTIAGLNAEVMRLRVQVERERNAPPGKTPGTTVTSPPINLPSKHAADKAAGQADQLITFRGEIKPGTLTWACLIALVDLKCPEGQERSLPLSRSIAFDGSIARVAPGVFAAINVQNAPFAIAEVKTTTRVLEAKIEPIRVRPEYLAGTVVVFGASSQIFAFVGGTYENFLSGGLYRIGVGASFNSAQRGISVPTYMVGFTKPLF